MSLGRRRFTPSQLLLLLMYPGNDIVCLSFCCACLLLYYAYVNRGKTEM